MASHFPSASLSRIDAAARVLVRARGIYSLPSLLACACMRVLSNECRAQPRFEVLVSAAAGDGRDWR